MLILIKIRLPIYLIKCFNGEIELEFSGSSDANSNADGKIDLEFSGSSDTNSNKHINADGSEILSNMNEYE